MSISPDVHILTSAELKQVRDIAFKRGVDRGRFEVSVEAPFETAMQILELGCSLFFGRNGDASHMNDDEYQQAHLAWFERASKFVREQKDRAVPRNGSSSPASTS